MNEADKWNTVYVLNKFFGMYVFFGIHAYFGSMIEVGLIAKMDIYFWLIANVNPNIPVYNESLANKDLDNTDFSKTLTRSDETSCTKNLANT